MKNVSLFTNRNFWLLAIGQGVSRLGDGLYVAALAWITWTLAHSLEDVALVTLASNLPTFIGSVIGASFADRYDRKRIMIGCDVVRTFLILPVPLLLDLGKLNIIGLIVIAVLVGIAGTPFAPARDALVPQVVGTEDLLTANALLQISFRSAFFVGPLLLAPLISLFPFPDVFYADVATFICSFVMLAMMHIPPTSSAPTRLGLWADLLAGWLVLRQVPEVRIVITTFVLAILFASGFLSVGVVDLVQTQLHGGADQYGFLLGVSGLAEVGGALLLTRLPLRNLAVSAVLSWSLLGLFRLPLGFITTLVGAAALLGLTGLLSALTDIPLIALVQSKIPDYHLAKVLGLWEAGIIGAVSIAPLLASAVLTRIDLQSGFALSGAALIGLGLISAMFIFRAQAKVAVASGSVEQLPRETTES